MGTLPQLQPSTIDETWLVEREPELRERLGTALANGTYLARWYVEDVTYLLEIIQELQNNDNEHLYCSCI